MITRRHQIAWLALGAALMASAPAGAASIHLDLPGIPGENGTPGYPDAMLLRTLTLAPHELRFVKPVDAASPAIGAAVLTGAIFPSGSALFYDATPPDQPDVVLPLQNLLASSQQPIGDPFLLLEEDAFASPTPAAIFLELPGIPGENDTPGHPGVIALESIAIESGSFSVVKRVDAASPSIQTAVALGSLFPSARLLLYDVLPASGPPDAVLAFEQVLATSSQPEPGGGTDPLERDGFVFQSIPEPARAALDAAGLGALAATARRRRSRGSSSARSSSLAFASLRNARQSQRPVAACGHALAQSNGSSSSLASGAGSHATSTPTRSVSSSISRASTSATAA